MHSGRKYKHSALSHFTGPFSMHIELYVWMPMASGLTQAFQASDAQAGDPSQLAGLPSNLPVTSANDRTRRNGYRNAAAYWQWQLQFTGKERLISSVQLPFPLREGKRDSRDWAGDNMSRQKSIFCSHPLTLSESLILSDSKCLLGQQGARAVKEKGQSRQRFDQTLILKVYMWTFQHFPHRCQEKKKKGRSSEYRQTISFWQWSAQNNHKNLRQPRVQIVISNYLCQWVFRHKWHSKWFVSAFQNKPSWSDTRGNNIITESLPSKSIVKNSLSIIWSVSHVLWVWLWLHIKITAWLKWHHGSNYYYMIKVWEWLWSWLEEPTQPSTRPAPWGLLLCKNIRLILPMVVTE